MILGFRANINQDSHRIFLTRITNAGAAFRGIPSLESNEVYSFIFDTEEDFRIAQRVKRSMSERYEDVPMHKSL